MRLLVLPLLLGIGAGGFAQAVAEGGEKEVPAPSPTISGVVPLRVYNEQGRLFGEGWAIPVQGGYVTIRTLLAGAARAELVLPGDQRDPLVAVSGEDIEANLVVVHTEREPREPLAPDSEPAGDRAAFSLACGGESIRVVGPRLRDIPVFGFAWTGMGGQRTPILGCPARGAGGEWQGVVAWESPFGKPSMAIVPSSRVGALLGATRKSWDEWRAVEELDKSKLRHSLQSEAIQDLWREDFRTAEATLSLLLENDPDNGRAWYFCGYAKAMQGRRREAVADYVQAISRQPDNAEMHFSLGLSYALLLEIPKAAEQVSALETLDADLARRLEVVVESLSDSQHEHGAEHPHDAGGDNHSEGAPGAGKPEEPAHNPGPGN